MARLNLFGTLSCPSALFGHSFYHLGFAFMPPSVVWALLSLMTFPCPPKVVWALLDIKDFLHLHPSVGCDPSQGYFFQEKVIRPKRRLQGIL